MCDGICDGQSEGYVNGRDSELNGSNSTSNNFKLARIQSLADWDPTSPYATRGGTRRESSIMISDSHFDSDFLDDDIS